MKKILIVLIAVMLISCKEKAKENSDLVIIGSGGNPSWGLPDSSNTAIISDDTLPNISVHDTTGIVAKENYNGNLIIYDSLKTIMALLSELKKCKQ